MLQLTFKPQEVYNEETNSFNYAFRWEPNKPVSPDKVFTVQMEHSLLSLSRWEEKWKIPFLSRDIEKTAEQTIDYIRFMTLTKNVPDAFYTTLSQDDVNTISAYIEDSHTATWFSEKEDANTGKGKTYGRKKEQVITAELIYYWMIAQQIPWDPTERWHLNRLLTLIRVCSIKNAPPDKKNKNQLASDFRRVKAAQRAARKKP